MLGGFDATLRRYRSSSFGRYVARSMSLAMQGLRLLGLAGLWLGAWYRQPLAIALGLGMIAVAWMRGWLWPPRGSPPPPSDPGGQAEEVTGRATKAGENAVTHAGASPG